MSDFHPTPEELQALLNGTLTRESELAIREHFARCDGRCLRSLDLIRRAARPQQVVARLDLSSLPQADAAQDWWNSVPECLIESKTFDASSLAIDTPSPPVTFLTRLDWRHRIEAGGQGDVHLYEDRVLGRRVALKFGQVMSPEESRGACHRFARECLITSRLEHPGVAPIYAVGLLPIPETQDATPPRPMSAHTTSNDSSNVNPPTDRTASQPVYAMRYVRGETLSVRIEKFHRENQRLSRDSETFVDLLRRIQAVCGTVNHAHERQIVHRDLKPQNIMVSSDSTVVIDWGLAVADIVDEDDGSGHGELPGVHSIGVHPENNVLLSHTRDFQGTLGTPEYMAPERAMPHSQARNASRASSCKAADIFGLGAILFEVLTGRPPHQKRESESIPQFLQRIATPPKRSLSSPAADSLTHRVREWLPRSCQPPITQTPLAMEYTSLLERKAIPPELASICLTAVAFNPQDRYSQASDLAGDLENWLIGRQVLVHRYTMAERLSRWISRHSILVTAGFLLALMGVLAATAVAVVWKSASDRERKLRESAQMAEQAAGLQRDKAQRAELAARVQEREAELARREAERNANTLLVKRHRDAIQGTVQATNLGDIERARQFQEDLPDTWDGRFGLSMINNDPQEMQVLTTGDWGILDAAIHPDGDHVLCADATGQLVLWSISKSRALWIRGKTREHTTLNLKLHHLLGRPRASESTEWGRCNKSVVWFSNGQNFATASSDGRGRTGDLSTDVEKIVVDCKQPLECVRASSDGAELLFGSADGQVFLRSANGEVISDLQIGTAAVTDSVWHSRGNQWIIADAGGMVTAIDRKSLSKSVIFTTKGAVTGTALHESPTISRLVVSGEQMPVREFTWNEANQTWENTGAYPLSDRDGANFIERLTFANNGQLLIAATMNGELRAWQADAKRLHWTRKGHRSDNRRVQLLENLPNAPDSRPLSRCYSRICSQILAFNDGKRILTVGDDARLVEWRLPPGSRTFSQLSQENFGSAPRLMFDAKRPYLWTLSEDGRLSIAALPASKVLAQVLDAHKPVSESERRASIAFHSQRNGVLTAGGDDTVREWRFEDGKIVRNSRELRHDAAVVSVTVNDNGELVATVDAKSRLRVFDYQTGELIFKDDIGGIPGLPPLSGKLAFNPGTTLLAAFGAMQSAPVYEIRHSPWRFRRLNEQIWVAGPRGGVAMVWNPAIPNAAVIADDHPRLHSQAIGSENAGQEYYFEPTPPTIAALTTSHDRRRIVCLEPTGQFAFFDARTQTKMLQLQSQITKAADVAMSHDGRWLAVSGFNGLVETWDVGPTPAHVTENLTLARIAPGAPLATSASDQATNRQELPTWSSRSLIERTSRIYRFDEQQIKFDSSGRLHLLAVISQPGDMRTEGELYLLTEAPEEWV